MDFDFMGKEKFESLSVGDVVRIADWLSGRNYREAIKDAVGEATAGEFYEMKYYAGEEHEVVKLEYSFVKLDGIQGLFFDRFMLAPETIQSEICDVPISELFGGMG